MKTKTKVVSDEKTINGANRNEQEMNENQILGFLMFFDLIVGNIKNIFNFCVNKKIGIHVFLIFSIFGILMYGASAEVITEFSDGEGNNLGDSVDLTFTDESFQTIYVAVQNGAYVSNANLKITGSKSDNSYPTLPGLIINDDVPVICSWEDFGECALSDGIFDLTSCALDCAQQACKVDESEYIWKQVYSEYPENKIVKGFGEFSDIQNIGQIKTYLKADKTLTANKLGLYVSEIHGNPHDLDITATVSICSTTQDPENEDIGGASCSDSIVIDSVDIPEAFGKTTGWKYLDLDNSFDFVAGEWYIIKIDEVVASNSDDIRDEYVIGAIETRHTKYASGGFDENFDTISKNYYSLSASFGEFDTYVILDLADEFNEYLEDCGESGDCLIPLKFYSGSEGIINLKINVITGTEPDPVDIPVDIPDHDVPSKGVGCGSVGYIEVVEVSPVPQEYPAGVIVFPEDKLCGNFEPPVTSTNFNADDEFEHALRTHIDNYVVSLLGAEIVGSGIEGTDSAEVMLIADQETKWDFDADIAADKNNIRTMIADKWHSNTLKIMDKLCYKWHEDPATDGTSFNFDPAQSIQFSGRVVTSIDHVSFDRNEECGDVEVQSQWLGVDYFIEEVSYPSYTLEIGGASQEVAEKYDNLVSYYYYESLKDMAIYIQAVMDNYEKPLEEARVNGLSDYYYDHSIDRTEPGSDRPSETIYEDLRSLATVVSLAEVVKAYEVPTPQSPVEPSEYNSVGGFGESELFVGYDINGVDFFPEEFGGKASLSLVNPDYLYYCTLFPVTSEMVAALNGRNLTWLNYLFNEHAYYIPPDAEITEQGGGWIIESKKVTYKVPYTPSEPVEIVPQVKPGEPVPEGDGYRFYHPPDPPEDGDPLILKNIYKVPSKIPWWDRKDMTKAMKDLLKKMLERGKAGKAKISTKIAAKIWGKIGAIDLSTITQFKDLDTTYETVCADDTCGLYITSVTPTPIEITVTDTSPATLTVTLEGTPGIAAEFDIGIGSPAGMTEGTPGIYTGTYTVTCEDIGEHTITGYLTDGTYTLDEVADTTVTVIDGGCLPDNLYITSGDCKLNHAPQAGQVTTITCTVTGTPSSSVTFDFGSMVSGTLTETQSGTYTGAYTFTPTCNDVGAHVVAISLSKGTETIDTTTYPPITVGEGSCNPSCGDGTCSGGETCETCPEDCECHSCGDGTCGDGETCETCPEDCGSCCGDAVACWRFEEGSGTIAGDSTGNNDGTIYGATFDDGVSGSALSFDGVDDYVEVPYSSSFDVHGSPHTVITWIKTSTSSTRKSIIAQDDWGWGYWVTSSEIRVHTNTGNAISLLDYSGTFDSNWHMIGQIYDGTNLYVILDGQIVKSGITRTATNRPWSNGEMRIGHSPTSGSANYFNGTIDEARIYDYALPPSDILEHYTAVCESSDKC